MKFLPISTSQTPVEDLKERLLGDGVLCNQDIEGMIRNLEVEIEEAVAFAKESPFPEGQLLLKDVYAP